jgi:cell wall-associated NlpC family hydrolase
MKYLIDYGMSFVGRPYIWGGDDPMRGFDCSGLVQEILASAGLDPVGDQTAQALYDHFEKNGSFNVWGAGSLCFYGKDAKHITHIGFCIDQYRMIEAGGGGSKTLTEKDAIAQNAFVRIRPIKKRGDLVAVIKPNYAPIGLI